MIALIILSLIFATLGVFVCIPRNGLGGILSSSLIVAGICAFAYIIKCIIVHCP